MILHNAAISELLARESETAKPPLNRAFKRAARAAILWPQEATAIVASNESLQDLTAIGPFLEKVILRWIDLPPEIGEIPPLRRQFFVRTEVDAILAKKGDWISSLRGDLQMHTEWSDGSGTVKQMAEAATARGYQYIAITDHAKKLKIAGGMTEEELAEQSEEIANVNSTFKSFRVLRSIELNLDQQGNGDMEAASLEKLDVIIAAFHSALRKTDDQTERYLAALRNPFVHILGHPRGRIYNFRLGLSADWTRVFSLAAELGKAVEIDSYPDRQDLNLDLVKIAAKSGAYLSLGTDAHHPWQLPFIEFGLAAAVAAKFPRERILNFMSADELKNWVAAVKR